MGDDTSSLSDHQSGRWSKTSLALGSESQPFAQGDQYWLGVQMGLGWSMYLVALHPWHPGDFTQGLFPDIPAVPFPWQEFVWDTDLAQKRTTNFPLCWGTLHMAALCHGVKTDRGSKPRCLWIGNHEYLQLSHTHYSHFTGNLFYHYLIHLR